MRKLIKFLNSNEVLTYASEALFVLIAVLCIYLIIAI